MPSLTSPPRPVKSARNKPARRVHLFPGNPALLEMTIGTEVFSYWLTPLPSDFGQGFRLRKPLPSTDSYDVHLGADGVNTCECPGHARWGHRTVCKHVAALLALRAEGKLVA